MKERILNLLSLCMDAQDKGFDVKLEIGVFFGNNRINNLWHYGLDNGKLFIIRHLDNIDEAETYLKGLIENGEHEID